MKAIQTFIFLFFFSSTITFAQQVNSSLDSISKYYPYDTFEYKLRKNERWAKNRKTKTYDNQGQYHSAFITLNNDSSFSFMIVFEPGMFLTLGKWKILNDSILSMNWNEKETMKANKEEIIYKKFYEYTTPQPYPINNWKFIIKGKKLIPTKRKR